MLLVVSLRPPPPTPKVGPVLNSSPRVLFSRNAYGRTRNAHGRIMGLLKQSKMPYNKQLLNFKRLVFTGNS